MQAKSDPKEDASPASSSGNSSEKTETSRRESAAVATSGGVDEPSRETSLSEEAEEPLWGK